MNTITAEAQETAIPCFETGQGDGSFLNIDHNAVPPDETPMTRNLPH
ncbi:MAG: hypothetical protein ACLSUW_09270 [Akkermansia sp.]